MKKFFGAGICFVLIVGIYSLLKNDIHVFFYSTGMIGIGSFILSGIISGAFVNGDQMRANFWVEQKQDRLRRTSSAIKLFLFGLPNILAAVFTYLISMR